MGLKRWWFRYRRPRFVSARAPLAAIGDSLGRIRDGLAAVPEGKRGVFAVATDWKFGFVPVIHAGVAVKVAGGWQVYGEGFMSAAEKGVRFDVAWTW